MGDDQVPCDCMGNNWGLFVCEWAIIGNLVCECASNDLEPCECMGDNLEPCVCMGDNQQPIVLFLFILLKLYNPLILATHKKILFLS